MAHNPTTAPDESREASPALVHEDDAVFSAVPEPPPGGDARDVTPDDLAMAGEANRTDGLDHNHAAESVTDIGAKYDKPVTKQPRLMKLWLGRAVTFFELIANRILIFLRSFSGKSPVARSGGGTKRRLFAKALRSIITFVKAVGLSVGQSLWRITSLASLSFIVIALLFVVEIAWLESPRDTPQRALDPNSQECADGLKNGWDDLFTYDNHERDLVKEQKHTDWRERLSCSIQRHRIPGYFDASLQSYRSLTYDLAFLEFQENGKPYVLLSKCSAGDAGCREGDGNRKMVNDSRDQLRVLLNHLQGLPLNYTQRMASLATVQQMKQYVLVFIHGWRHDAGLGDSNVENARLYAAHVARFIADRAQKDSAYKDIRLTAVYVGWRGARVDEKRLAEQIPLIGESIGTLAAGPTLFDRKPVSEAISPMVLGALRSIESALEISNKLTFDRVTGAPKSKANRMIVFGHSLGGNLLATAIQDDVLKKIANHTPGNYLPPALGDLVVLINPAAEAEKWTSFQRSIWNRTVFAPHDRIPGTDAAQANGYFRADQRPILISVTAARDWPPGGKRLVDCDRTATGDASGTHNVQTQVQDAATLLDEGGDYDDATQVFFPMFKANLRPLADWIELYGTGDDPRNECSSYRDQWRRDIFKHPGRTIAYLTSSFLRLFPFMQTNPEATYTIGHLDPARHPQATNDHPVISPRPFGTTHELLSSDKLGDERVVRKTGAKEGYVKREVPIEYDEVLMPAAECPRANNWLTRARDAQIAHPDGATTGASGWDSDTLAHGTPARGEGGPALRFHHGFLLGGISPPTRGADPFWNMRAFSTALAQHNGYLLSSFICAMNQLVLDDITTIQ